MSDAFFLHSSLASTDSIITTLRFGRADVDECERLYVGNLGQGERFNTSMSRRFTLHSERLAAVRSIYIYIYIYIRIRRANKKKSAKGAKKYLTRVF